MTQMNEKQIELEKAIGSECKTGFKAIGQYGDDPLMLDLVVVVTQELERKYRDHKED